MLFSSCLGLLSLDIKLLGRNLSRSSAGLSSRSGSLIVSHEWGKFGVRVFADL